MSSVMIAWHHRSTKPLSAMVTPEALDAINDFAVEQSYS
jgi:hypothetical protein